MMQVFTEEGWSIVTNKNESVYWSWWAAMVPILLHLFHKHDSGTPTTLLEKLDSTSPTNRDIAESNSRCRLLHKGQKVIMSRVSLRDGRDETAAERTNGMRIVHRVSPSRRVFAGARRRTY
jgi:hypothetical protein